MFSGLSWFHEKLKTNEITVCTLWKLRKFTLTHFWQKFRESNVFTYELVSRNIFDESESLGFPHNKKWNLKKFTLTLFWLNVRVIGVFTKEISKQLIWRNICTIWKSKNFFWHLGFTWNQFLWFWEVKNSFYTFRGCEIWIFNCFRAEILQTLWNG